MVTASQSGIRSLEWKCRSHARDFRRLRSASERVCQMFTVGGKYSVWSAAAERSGDAALARLPRHATSLPRVLRSQSGVAARPTRSALKIAHEYAWLAGWSFAIVNQSVAVICRSWHLRPTASPIVNGGKAKQRPRYTEKRIFAGNRQTKNCFCLWAHNLGCAFSAKTPRRPEPGASLRFAPVYYGLDLRSGAQMREAIV